MNMKSELLPSAERYAELIKTKDHVCPCCGSGEVEGKHVDIQREEAHQECWCGDCEANWTDVYKISRFILHHDPFESTRENPPDYTPESIARSIIKEAEARGFAGKCKSFSDLHDHCDANMLGDAATILNTMSMKEATPVLNAAYTLVSTYLSGSEDIRPLDPDPPVFKLARFNPRRVARGKEGAHVLVTWDDGTRELLWMSLKNLKDNMKSYGSSAGLDEAIAAYAANTRYPARD